MDFLLFVVVFFALCTTAVLGQQYTLKDSWFGDNFFSKFNYGTHSNTFSDFITNETEARQMGLINNTNTTAYIGTDYWNVVNESGRPSIKIISKESFYEGLFVFDTSHMPFGCGVWPSIYMWGPDGQRPGEIDVIEGINLRTDDQSTCHTGPNCTFSSIANTTFDNMTGSWISYNCYVPSDNAGCGIYADNPNTYGQGFNENGGGVFALEVNKQIGIRIWFWLHNDIPPDIVQKTPDPNLWGIPYAYWPFGSWCTADHFAAMMVHLDLYYCGWAGSESEWNKQCNAVAKGQSCEDFVANNPSYFHDAYWLVNYFDIYQ